MVTNNELDAERTAFEAWAKEKAPGHSRMRLGNGEYEHYAIQCAWQGWLAARRSTSGSDACAEMRALCSNCGGTGEVHRADGEYMGECSCEASGSDEVLPVDKDSLSDGARAKIGSVMPCGACVTNVFEAYAAGKKAAGGSDGTDTAGEEGHTVDHRELAGKILAFSGISSRGSMEPGADPLADRLAEKLAGWGVTFAQATSGSELAGFGVAYNRAKFSRSVNREDFEAGWNAAIAQQAGAPVMYVRKFDIDGTMPGSTVVANKVKDEDWSVPVYLAAPAPAAEEVRDASKPAGEIVQDVADVFRSADFEVREELGTAHQFAVTGSLDSAAILLESVLARPRVGVDGLIPMQALHNIIEPYAHSIIKRGFTEDEQNKRLHVIADWIEAVFDARCASAAGEIQTDAARDVLAERRRQVDAEGWTPALDDDYADGQLSMAAACYAMQGNGPDLGVPDEWPWNPKWWKPTTDRRNLVKAAALILADIERIDRAAMSASQGKTEEAK